MEILIQWSLRNKVGILLISLFLTLWGGSIAINLPIDVFPDLTAPMVTVICEAPGMAPVEVERSIAFPIETAINGAPGVRRVRSATASGITVIWCEFEWGTEIHAARQIVNEKLALVVEDLPTEANRPVLAPISSIMGEILFIALQSKTHSPMELRAYAENFLRRRLLSVSGVSQVTPIGGDEKQFQILLRPDRLREYGLSAPEAEEAVRLSNLNIGAGILKERGTEFLINGIGRIRDLADLEAISISRKEGPSLSLRDIADLKVGPAPKIGEGSANGEKAVIIGIQKQPNGNTLELTRKLDSLLDEFERGLPPGMSLNRKLFRSADFIQVAVDNVMKALRDGVILVIVIVLIFLADFRATLITLTAIPLSLLTAVLTLKYFGFSLNTMSLGGMTIAIGSLVDDAIIVVENVHRRLREGGRNGDIRGRVISRATLEVGASIVHATVIIVLVFLPIFFLPGVEGRLLQPLGITYIASLLASLLVAVTVTPTACLTFLGHGGGEGSSEPLLVSILKSLYAKFLDFTLRHPFFTVAPIFLIFIIALASTRSWGLAFLPEFNEGALTIGVVSMPGISLERSDELGRAVEQTLLAHPEVVSTGRRTGRAELDEHVQGVEAGELDVTLRLGKGRSKEEFLAAVRRDLSTIPGANITIGQPISHRIDHMLSGTRASIAIKIFGPDLQKLRKLGTATRDAIQLIPGLVDLSLEQQIDVPQIDVRFDRLALAKHGIDLQSAAKTLAAGVNGLDCGEVLEGANAIPIVARFPDGGAPPLDHLTSLPLNGRGGELLTLGDVARIGKDIGPNLISREQVERKIVLSANVGGRDIGSVVGEIRHRVDPLIRAEVGYRVEYGGQFESAAESTRVILWLGLAAILAIGFILHLAFDSARDALIVMVNLPLALIGGVVGVFLSGGILNVASLIGFVTVFGIATRNGVMLISHIKNLQSAEGEGDFLAAIRRGSLERLTPILMTALAAGLALLPLAISGGLPGNEIQTPMAIVILCGLLSSMLLNMIVVPALYSQFGRPVALANGD